MLQNWPIGHSASVHIGGGGPPELEPSVPDTSVVEASVVLVVPSVALEVEGSDDIVVVVSTVVDGSLGLLVVVPGSVPCELPPSSPVVGVPGSVAGWPDVVIEPVSVSTPLGLVGVDGFVGESVVTPESPHANNSGETSAATLPTL
jgi:hypothetical protein